MPRRLLLVPLTMHHLAAPLSFLPFQSLHHPSRRSILLYIFLLLPRRPPVTRPTPGLPSFLLLLLVFTLCLLHRRFLLLPISNVAIASVFAASLVLISTLSSAIPSLTLRTPASSSVIPMHPSPIRSATLPPSLTRRCRRIVRRSVSNMSSAASACRPTRLLFTRLRAAVASSPPCPDFAACPLTFASNLGGGVAVSLQPSPTPRPLLRPLLSLSLVCPISTAVRMRNRSFCRFCNKPSTRVPPSSRVLVFLRSRFMAAGIFLRPLGLMDDACASFQRCSSCHMLVTPQFVRQVGSILI